MPKPKLIPIVVELVALRKKKRIPQSAVATEIGIDQAVVSNWEQGKRVPKGPALKLLEAFVERTRQAA